MLLSSRIFLSVNRAIVTPFTSSISSRRFPWVIWLVRGGKREVSLTPCRSSTFPPVLSSESPGRRGAFHGVELPWQSEFAVSSSPLPIQLKSPHQGALVVRRSRPAAALVILLVFGIGAPRTTAFEPAAKPVAPEVAAVVETTLGTAAGQIRQFAFDGDDT